MRNSMSPRWIAVTSFIVFVYLILVNAFLFPLVFPDGLAEKFTNARSQNLSLFHLLAFATTAILLTILVDKLVTGPGARSKGALAGILLGLFVALPEHLHLYAMLDVTAIRQFIPVLWIICTWGVAGFIVGFVRHQRQ